jgi:type IV secretory pathway TrbD component
MSSVLVSNSLVCKIVVLVCVCFLVCGFCWSLASQVSHIFFLPHVFEASFRSFARVMDVRSGLCFWRGMTVKRGRRHMFGLLRCTIRSCTNRNTNALKSLRDVCAHILVLARVVTFLLLGAIHSCWYLHVSFDVICVWLRYFNRTQRLASKYPVFIHVGVRHVEIKARFPGTMPCMCPTEATWRWQTI